MPNDIQGKSKPPVLRVVRLDRATRIFRWLLRVTVNGLLNCVNRRHPEASDFDEIEVRSDQYIIEDYEDGQLVRRTYRQRRNLTMPALLIVTVISTVAYYLLR